MGEEESNSKETTILLIRVSTLKEMNIEAEGKRFGTSKSTRRDNHEGKGKIPEGSATLKRQYIIMMNKRQVTVTPQMKLLYANAS